MQIEKFESVIYKYIEDSNIMTNHYDITYTYYNTSCCKTIIHGNVILIYLFVPTGILIFEICFRGIGGIENYSKGGLIRSSLPPSVVHGHIICRPKNWKSDAFIYTTYVTVGTASAKVDRVRQSLSSSYLYNRIRCCHHIYTHCTRMCVRGHIEYNIIFSRRK